jgi:uncharacterized protein (DUF608 family)
MKASKDRRSFIKRITIGGIGASVLPNILFAHSDSLTEDQKPLHLLKEKQEKRKYNALYTGENLNKIAFPIGGIGAGMFCLEGTGAISHLSVRHNPEMFFEPAMFAAISIKGMPNGAKVLEKNVPDWKKFGQRDAGLGGTAGATWGLPRFAEAEFLARFPFAEILLKDKTLPVEVRINGWSPFIPSDEDNSSLPVGGLEYHVKNTGNKAEEYVFSYNARNFMKQGNELNAIKPIKNGFILSQEATKDAPEKQGHFAIFTDDAATVVDHCWFRGGWFDPLTMAWNTIKNAETKDNPPVEKDSPGASLFVPFTLQPGENKVIRLMMAWYVPDTKLHIGDVVGAKQPDLPKYHRPWYSNRFKNIAEVNGYWLANYADLFKKTSVFTNSFYKSTLPAEVLEAVAANLTILKSATVLRQFDGRFWCFEGSGDNWGSCHGSCTHVWNYAQAVAHLFPSLERSLRNTEFNENQNDTGHQGFRANIPISPLAHNFHAAADGQLGGIMKVYREWRISGDQEWLKKIYPAVKASMDYCIRTWDPKKKGVVEEPHHNTYDIEFWGPTSMCTSFYTGALMAIAKMGKYLGQEVSEYAALYEKGKRYMETNLYNGEYFFQDIQWTNLSAKDPSKVQSSNSQTSSEAIALLKKEGPKYQYGAGCLSDGVLGSWIARVCALDEPLDEGKIKSHLLAVHKYNLKGDLSQHVNPQRPTFAIGKEGGLLLCSWPNGGMLSLPFVYSNEVWTGIEYQVASHLMFIGEVEKALEIVRACRDRYDGRVRNPFNEYECGHWYARAMSSYGCLQGLTGVRYDAVDKVIFVDSKIGDFTSFISTATGFGTVTLKRGKVSLNVVYGAIPAKEFNVSGKTIQMS